MKSKNLTLKNSTRNSFPQLKAAVEDQEEETLEIEEDQAEESQQVGVSFPAFERRSLLEHSQRSIYLSTDINEHTSEEVIASLLYLDKISNEPIKLFITTPGGSVVLAVAICDTITSLVSSPVITVGVGFVASAGVLLLASGVPSGRFATPNTRLMLHQIHSSNEGRLMDIKNDYEETKFQQDLYYSLLASKSNKNAQLLKNEFLGPPDKFFTVKKAKQWGFIDGILKPGPNYKKPRG